MYYNGAVEKLYADYDYIVHELCEAYKRESKNDITFDDMKNFTDYILKEYYKATGKVFLPDQFNIDDLLKALGANSIEQNGALISPRMRKIDDKHFVLEINDHEHHMAFWNTSPEKKHEYEYAEEKAKCVLYIILKHNSYLALQPGEYFYPFSAPFDDDFDFTIAGKEKLTHQPQLVKKPKKDNKQ